MRIFLIALLASLASPAAAERPVPLVPSQSGLDFAPEPPRVIGQEHPLFRRVLVDNVENMPGRVGPVFTPVTRPAEFNAALRRSLADSNMLAASAADARVRLKVSWQQFDLPLRIGLSSRAQVAIQYELVRIDTGQVIFSRTIATRAESRGGNAAIRAQGTGRAAVLTNIASVTSCLDKAAIGPAPADCALDPVGRFSAPITVVTPVYR